MFFLHSRRILITNSLPIVEPGSQFGAFISMFIRTLSDSIAVLEYIGDLKKTTLWPKALQEPWAPSLILIQVCLVLGDWEVYRNDHKTGKYTLSNEVLKIT